jgi:hypothetical protein
MAGGAVSSRCGCPFFFSLEVGFAVVDDARVGGAGRFAVGGEFRFGEWRGFPRVGDLSDPIG